MANPDHLAKLNEGVDVFNAWHNDNPEVLLDLRGAELIGTDLRGANLFCANLTGATLRQTNLAYADLSDADLINADLRGADLTDASLICANLTNAKLLDATLTGAKLLDATLTGAELICANLTNAELNNADLTDADLTGADLTGIRGFWNTHSVIAALLTLHSEEWAPVHILAAMIAASDECWEFWLNADSPCYAMFDNPQAVIDDALTILAQYAGDDAPVEVKERAND